LSVYGPNGFFRAFKGKVSANALHSHVEVRSSYETEGHGGVTLQVVNGGKHPADVTVRNVYTGTESREFLSPRDDRDFEFELQKSLGWYDFVVSIEGDADFEWRLAGHVETGRDSATDPALGGVIVKE
jgi:phospholipase C